MAIVTLSALVSIEFAVMPGICLNTSRTPLCFCCIVLADRHKRGLGSDNLYCSKLNVNSSLNTIQPENVYYEYQN